MKVHPAQLQKRHELEQSRRMVAVDTLNQAIRKNLVNLQCALGMLEGSHIFTAEEISYAEGAIQRLSEIDEGISNLFDTKNGKTSALYYHPTDLIEQVATIREIAYWTLPASGMLAVEKLIHEQLCTYEAVRTLIRILIGKDMEIALPRDPAPLPEIPPNRYLAITHPELVALAS